MHLLAKNDPCPIAKEVTVPVYAITGLFDPIVPWLSVRSWLKQNCPALKEFRIVRHSDHNVLGNAADTAAKYVLGWMKIPAAAGPEGKLPGELAVVSR